MNRAEADDLAQELAKAIDAFLVLPNSPEKATRRDELATLLWDNKIGIQYALREYASPDVVTEVCGNWNCPRGGKRVDVRLSSRPTTATEKS